MERAFTVDIPVTFLSSLTLIFTYLVVLNHQGSPSIPSSGAILLLILSARETLTPGGLQPLAPRRVRVPL